MLKKFPLPGWCIHDEKQIGGFRGPYAFLSNFYDCPIEYKGLDYMSVEAAFQAAKCRTDDEREIFTNLNPLQAKREGNKVKLRPYWDNVKYHIMTYLVMQKFERTPMLRTMILSTGTKFLIENNCWHDSVWGQAYNLVNGIWVKENNGENQLGEILMAVRLSLESV